MKRLLLLIITAFLFSITPIKAQSGFRSTWYYAERHHVQFQKVNNMVYSEWDQFGMVRYYEIWRKAVWHQQTGQRTYYAWKFYNGRYQWVSQYSFGTFWYFRWINFKRYFYYNNGYKFYF